MKVLQQLPKFHNKTITMDFTLKGKRIRMIEMVEDLYPIPSGAEGTIKYTDSMGTIHVGWDNGRGLGVIPNKDKYEILD